MSGYSRNPLNLPYNYNFQQPNMPGLGTDEKNIGALMKGEPVFVRVDAFDENGITEGEVFAL